MKFTEAQIEQSARTGWLALDSRDKFRYFRGGFGHLVVFVILPVVIFLFLTNIQISYWLFAFVVAALIMVAFVIISLLKLLDLPLVKVETSVPEKQFREIIVRFAKLRKWKVANNRKALMVLKTGPGRSGDTGWGERIMLITIGREVWISSIGDPDRPISLRSYRRNQRNISFMRDVLSGRRVPASEAIDNVKRSDL